MDGALKMYYAHHTFVLDILDPPTSITNAHLTAVRMWINQSVYRQHSCRIKVVFDYTDGDPALDLPTPDFTLDWFRDWPPRFKEDGGEIYGSFQDISICVKMEDAEHAIRLKPLKELSLRALLVG
jgi:hypothetical protein